MKVIFNHSYPLSYATCTTEQIAMESQNKKHEHTKTQHLCSNFYSHLWHFTKKVKINFLYYIFANIEAQRS